ncbi:MAG TPA: universal stress protein [Methylomirabilota bacterium]|jgi:nucleotide-binding universal stress UspA family protein
MNIGAANMEAASLQIDRPAPLEAQPTETAWAPRRVLVPLDGSSAAEAVIPFVSSLARPLGLEIALLRAVPRLVPQVTEGSRPTRVFDDMERLNQEAAAYLRGIADTLAAAGLRVSTSVRIGAAADEILAGARECEADLIAMTTQGRGALARLLFGTVAEAVLRQADVPVFVVRAAEAVAGKKAA